MRAILLSSVFMGVLSVIACASTDDSTGNGSSEEDIKKQFVLISTAH